MTLFFTVSRAARLGVALALFGMTLSAPWSPALAEWRVECDGESVVGVCRLHGVSVETRGDGGPPRARIEIHRQDGDWVGEAALPLGAYLPDGVYGVVDARGERFALAFLTCAPQGCLASFALTPDVLSNLRSGDALALTYVDAATGRPVRLRFDLNGFARAWRAATR